MCFHFISINFFFVLRTGLISAFPSFLFTQLHCNIYHCSLWYLHYKDDPNINEPSCIPRSVRFTARSNISIRAFYSPLFRARRNCLNTFSVCPCTEEQLEWSYQVFFYICIIVNIPYSVALKFKFLPTNRERREGCAIPSADKCRQRESG